MAPVHLPINPHMAISLTAADKGDWNVITTAENLLSLTEAAHSLPHHPHISTLWRWCKKGCRGTRLDFLRLGGRIFVSREALLRFGEAMAASDGAPPAPPMKAKRTPAERAAAVAAAKAKLDR